MSCSKLQGKNSQDSQVQNMFRQFMDTDTGYAPVVQDVSNTPRYIVDPAMARRETRNTRRRRRFDNHSFSGKEAKPTQQTLREKATTEGPTTPLRMCVSLHNLAKVCGMFRGHITLYVGKYTEERKFQAMFDKYFTERPLTLAVDFEWVANYDPDDFIIATVYTDVMRSTSAFIPPASVPWLFITPSSTNTNGANPDHTSPKRLNVHR